jgi:hypothetical protein
MVDRGEFIKRKAFEWIAYKKAYQALYLLFSHAFIG